MTEKAAKCCIFDKQFDICNFFLCVKNVINFFKILLAKKFFLGLRYQQIKKKTMRRNLEFKNVLCVTTKFLPHVFPVLFNPKKET